MINILTGAAPLRFEAVDVVDIKSVKHFFNALHGRAVNTAIAEDFGIPFLLAKRGEELTGFASLVISKAGEKHMTFFGEPVSDAEQMQEWQVKAQQEFERRFGQSADSQQLKHKIVRWVDWLNNAVA